MGVPGAHNQTFESSAWAHGWMSPALYCNRGWVYNCNMDGWMDGWMDSLRPKVENVLHRTLPYRTSRGVSLVPVTIGLTFLQRPERATDRHDCYGGSSGSGSRRHHSSLRTANNGDYTNRNVIPVLPSITTCWKRTFHREIAISTIPNYYYEGISILRGQRERCPLQDP